MEISFKDFLSIVVKKIPIIILGTLIGFVSFFTCAKLTEVPSYSCEVTMIVNAAPDTIATSGNIKASQDLARAYIAIMKDYSFSEKIKQQLPASCDYTIEQIRKHISSSTVDNSQILATRVTTPSAKDSYTIAKVIEKITPETLRKYFDETGSIVILRSAEKPEKADKSSIRIISFLGALVGFIISACIIFLIAKFDKRIRNEEDINAITKYPVLGSIRSVE